MMILMIIPVFPFIDDSYNDKITKRKQRNFMEIKCKTKQQNTADDDDDDISGQLDQTQRLYVNPHLHRLTTLTR